MKMLGRKLLGVLLTAILLVETMGLAMAAPSTMAEKLAERGVAVRAGLHCAPLAHKTAGTYSTGTLRMSVSPFTSAGKIRKTLSRLEKI